MSDVSVARGALLDDQVISKLIDKGQGNAIKKIAFIEQETKRKISTDELLKVFTDGFLLLFMVARDDYQQLIAKSRRNGHTYKAGAREITVPGQPQSEADQALTDLTYKECVLVQEMIKIAAYEIYVAKLLQSRTANNEHILERLTTATTEFPQRLRERYPDDEIHFDPKKPGVLPTPLSFYESVSKNLLPEIILVQLDFARKGPVHMQAEPATACDALQLFMVSLSRPRAETPQERVSLQLPVGNPGQYLAIPLAVFDKS